MAWDVLDRVRHGGVIYSPGEQLDDLTEEQAAVLVAAGVIVAVDETEAGDEPDADDKADTGKEPDAGDKTDTGNEPDASDIASTKTKKK